MVTLNRPAKMNALNDDVWNGLISEFGKLACDSSVRAIVLCGAGKAFTAGLDLVASASLLEGASDDVGRRAFQIRTEVRRLQRAVSAPELCPQPVIAAVHGACIGGGIDLITACDIRVCSDDAFFTVKEVDIGVTADVGTLQRLPKVIGNQSAVRELAFTARKFYADEALRLGLVSSTHNGGRDGVLTAALDLASLIASKTPLAVAGTKANLLFSRDNTVDAALNYVATWNAGFVQTDDVGIAVGAFFSKTKPVFSKL